MVNSVNLGDPKMQKENAQIRKEVSRNFQGIFDTNRISNENYEGDALIESVTGIKPSIESQKAKKEKQLPQLLTNRAE